MCRLWLDLALSTCPLFVRGARPTQSWLGLKLIATVIHHRVDYNHPHQYDRWALKTVTNQLMMNFWTEEEQMIWMIRRT